MAAQKEQPKRQVQGRAERTRSKIIDAATREFEENGYGGASVNKILDRAGVAKGSFYHQFDKKEDLVGAIFTLTMTLDGLQPQENNLQVVIDTGMVLAHRIRREGEGEGGPGLLAALRLSVERNAPFTFGSPWPAWVEINTRQLNAAQEAGELRLDVDTSALARRIAGQWAGVVLVTHSQFGNLDMVEAEISGMYEDLLLANANPRFLAKASLNYSESRGRELWEVYLKEVQGTA